MRITRTEIEGSRGSYATISRRQDSRWIEVTIITQQHPNGKTHRIPADADESELRKEAASLQHTLDGVRGTCGDIDEYYRELQRFQG